MARVPAWHSCLLAKRPLARSWKPEHPSHWMLGYPKSLRCFCGCSPICKMCHNPLPFLHGERNDTLRCKYKYGVSLILLLNCSHLQINWTGKWLPPWFNDWLVLLPLFLQKVKLYWTAESWRAVFIHVTSHLTLMIIPLKPIGLLEFYACICTTKGFAKACIKDTVWHYLQIRTPTAAGKLAD